MTSRVLASSDVINFPDHDFSDNAIMALLKAEADIILQDFAIDSLAGWEVLYRAVYGNRPTIGVCTRMPSYKLEKQKLITIHIPIPTRDIVSWGVDPKQHITLGVHPSEHKYIKPLAVEFTDFTNCTDYITGSMRRAIAFCFENGFRVNSILIKAKQPANSR
ncbi:Imm9 family immunity protein [Hymenobacter swuensis]|uniref:Imm9 family immunity protein n=1 Tax=Hymenobacter swuensis TaxID=1446467 RepID=UPI0009DDDD91|nr:Imm9 family immunity protein [Hymenobacter swuensis]